MSRKALGRGLKALIPDTKPAGGQAVLELEVDRILPGRYQPRQDFDSDRIRDLALSIKARGVIQPVIVQPAGGNTFELIAGERRWRAAREAGLKHVPAIVREAGESESLELALIENLQREDLNPVEAARAYRQLVETFGLTQEEVAVQVGKDRSSVANHLRLLKLPSEIQEDLARGRLTMGHARALLSLHGKERQLRARSRIISGGLSVRETEALVKKLTSTAVGQPRRKPEIDIFIKDLEDNLRRSLGTKVAIRPTAKGGTIVIRYFSTSELERLTGQIAEGGMS